MFKSTLILGISCLLMACGSSSNSPSDAQAGDSSSSASDSSSNGSASSAPNDEPKVGLALLPETPTPTNPDVIPEGINTYFVSPDGSDSLSGAEDAPFRSLLHAANLAEPGDVIVVRGGHYDETRTLQIRPSSAANGTAEAPITVFAYPGERPIFDFAGLTDGRHGIRLDTDYWHIYGLEIRNAHHNGFGLEGSHNRVERVVVTGSEDTGFNVSGRAAHNLIMNCDSYRNFNSVSTPIGNRADGFGAKGGNLGEGNVFYGNRSWENSDDGFDFWGAPNPVVLYNNWAFNNGDPDVFGNPEGFEGGGNGFKLGQSEPDTGNHLVYRNLAFDNRGPYDDSKGFDQNQNSGEIVVVNNTAYNNGRNYVFPTTARDRIDTFWNNASLAGSVGLSYNAEREHNSWQLDGDLSAADFVSLDTSLAYGDRQADGSLPDIDLLRPVADSILVGAGKDVGRPFNGEAPDIGAYEH